MRLRLRRLLVLGSLGLALLGLTPHADAQAPPGPCAPGMTARGFGRGGRFFGGRPAARGMSARGAGGAAGYEAGGTTGLPRGRRYYNGRYFGSFNNRFYGPQYGYF